MSSSFRLKKSKGKIKNATKCEYKGIKFKSKLELFTYKELEKLNIPFKYEEVVFEIIPKFQNNIQLYLPNRNKELAFKECKYLGIKYTPDFTINLDNVYIIIEDKGMPNETYGIRRKLFLKWLGEKNDKTYYFLEPHNQKDILFCISLIKQIINL